MALKFILDIDTKLGASATVARTLRSLERTLVRLDPELKVTRTAAYALGTALGVPLRVGLELTKVLAKVGALGLGAAGSFLGNAASTALGFASVEGIKAIASGLVDLTKEMITTASAAERTHRAFSLLFGAQLGPALEGQIENFAKHTAVDDDVFKGIVGGLKQAGLPDIEKNWRGITQTITDLAALDLGKGSQAEKIESFGDAFINLAKRGEVSSRMLGALGISQQAFWSDLAGKLNMSVEETKKAAGKGKVALTDINNEIGSLVFQKTGKPVGSVGFLEGAGPEAALGRVGRIKDELFKGLAGSPELAKLAVGLDRIASAFDPDSPNGKRIVAGLQNFVGTVGDALKGIDIEKISTTLIDLFTKLPPLINATTKAALGLATVLVKILPNAPALPGSAEDESRRQSIRDEKGKHPALAGASSWVLDHVFGKPELPTANASGALGSGATDGAAKMGEAMGDAMAGGTQKALGIHSPSTVYKDFGEMSRVGFEQGFAQPAAVPAPSRSLDTSVAAWGGGGGISVTVPVTVNYNGPGGEEGAQELRERLADILPGQLQAAFEQLRLEMGTA